MQEGKSAAMMALEGGTHRDGYICFLLVAAAGADLEGVDRHHKSYVSFFCDPVALIFFFRNCLIGVFPFKCLWVLLSTLSGRHKAWGCHWGSLGWRLQCGSDRQGSRSRIDNLHVDCRLKKRYLAIATYNCFTVHNPNPNPVALIFSSEIAW